MKSSLFIERHTICNATILSCWSSEKRLKTLCFYLQYCIRAKQSKKIMKITLAVRTDEYFLNSYQQPFECPTVYERLMNDKWTQFCNSYKQRSGNECSKGWKTNTNPVLKGENKSTQFLAFCSVIHRSMLTTMFGKLRKTYSATAYDILIAQIENNFRRQCLS